MTIKDIYVHVGLPKTGTTFLQRNLAKIKNKLLDEGVKYYYCNNISSYGESLDDKITKIIISWEKYSQPIGFGDFEKIIEISKEKYQIDIDRIRILICFREQISLIESIFSQRIKEGQLFSDINEFIENDLSKYFLYDYKDLIDFYISLDIKKENILYFWYEDYYRRGISHFFDWFRKATHIESSIPIVLNDPSTYNKGLSKSQINALSGQKCNINVRKALEKENKNVNMYRKFLVDSEFEKQIRKKYELSNKDLGFNHTIDE